MSLLHVGFILLDLNCTAQCRGRLKRGSAYTRVRTVSHNYHGRILGINKVLKSYSKFLL